MWLSFDASGPAALQVGVGKVCAVSGLPWIEHLVKDPQNYVALPDQPWLDGINAGDGFIRQFVAGPLGSGATVEGQVTGEETHGGVQVRAVGLTEQGAGGVARCTGSNTRLLRRHDPDGVPGSDGVGEYGPGGRRADAPGGLRRRSPAR
jgi:hypothetical protein